MVTAAQGAAASVCAWMRFTEWWMNSHRRDLPCAARGDPHTADRLLALQINLLMEGGRPRPPRLCSTAWIRLRDQRSKGQPERSGDRLERNDSRAAGSPGGEINIRDERTPD